MIVLDSHAVLWWTGAVESALSETAEQRIADELDAGEIVISTITTWEIALLVSSGRLALRPSVEDWVRDVESLSRVRFVAVDNRIAIETNQLPGRFHRDPADRIIVATARLLEAELVTIDTKIRAYPHVQTIW